VVGLFRQRVFAVKASRQRGRRLAAENTQGVRVRVSIDLERIKDWETFHEAFHEAMGFPGFYGRNMDAWIDCMSYIDEPGAGMSQVTVKLGETLELKGVRQFGEKCPDILCELVLCSGFVNERFIEAGSDTQVSLIAI
jgi:hypothetical protein